MSGQLYPTPDRLNARCGGCQDLVPTHNYGPGCDYRPGLRTPCANEDCRVCRPRASSQAGLATLRAGAMPDRAAISILAAQAGPEGAPVGSILRTADGAVYRRGRKGWFRLGAVSHTPDTPAGDLIYRGSDQ